MFGPQRFLQISYKQLVLNPEDMSKKIMQFAGLPYQKEVSEKAKKLTQSNGTFKGGFNPEKPRNSSVNLDLWKQRLPVAEREKIERYYPCEKIIETIENLDKNFEWFQCNDVFDVSLLFNFLNAYLCSLSFMKNWFLK